MIDYHLHGDFCGHGKGSLEEYVLSALARGFVEIGFSAHLPLVTKPDPYHAMLEERLPEYVRLVNYLQEKYSGRIRIRLGIEADYFQGYESETRRLLSRAAFDYVLGAVHFLGDWHFTSRVGRERYRTEDPARVFPAYFKLVGKMIESGLFDILAHPDAIVKEDFLPVTDMGDHYRKIARLLRIKNMAVEVNTAGLRRGAGAVYPGLDFLKACVNENIPVTLGSDAHIPSDVGRDFSDAFLLLSRSGVTDLALWKGRRMVRCPLDGKWVTEL